MDALGESGAWNEAKLAELKSAFIRNKSKKIR